MKSAIAPEKHVIPANEEAGISRNLRASSPSNTADGPGRNDADADDIMTPHALFACKGAGGACRIVAALAKDKVEMLTIWI